MEQITDPCIKRNISSDSSNTYVDVAVKCLNNQPKLRPTMAEVVVSLESALALQEKSTSYSLVEIMPHDSTEEDVDSSIRKVKSTNHHRGHECTGEEIVNVSHNWHHHKQSSARLAFTKRFSALLSVTTRMFSGNRDKKTSRYSKGAQSVNSNKLQAANCQRPVSLSMPLTRWGQEDDLQSSNLKSFQLIELEVATRKFHPDSVLGEGGFGSVFKGWIDEKTYAASKWGTGLVIAVKKLNLHGLQGHREWVAEINYLGTLRHPNLVKLIGYCLEKEQRLLVYEFMPQGSLEKHLFRRSSQPLSWNLRMSIALGAAKGIAYLHSAEAIVIYRDFKTSNILLDSNYNAKLSDFGLARDGPEPDRSHVSTRVMGTFGYAAPEYLATGHLTTKSDVYSFGVVLLEILAGRRVIDKGLRKKEQDLVSWAKPYLTSKDKVLRIMDVDIKGQYTVKEALSASSLALKCLSGNPKSRPDANHVVKALEQLQNLKN